MGEEMKKETERETKRPNILDGADDKRTDPKFNHKIGFIPFAYHLVPLDGLAKVATVMRKGERKDRNGWEQVSVEEHINHAVSHIVAYLRGRHASHHLANAGCRILMALDLDTKEVLPRPEIEPPSKQHHDWVEPEIGVEPEIKVEPEIRVEPEISDKINLAHSIKEMFDGCLGQTLKDRSREG